eukprot:scaffold114336_cov76-Cyclotella_meneghiniana.AAC.11
MRMLWSPDESRVRGKGLREKHRLTRACNAGIWLTCFPNQLNGTSILAEEFRDNVKLRYNLKPLGVPENCNGCGKKHLAPCLEQQQDFTPLVYSVDGMAG